MCCPPTSPARERDLAGFERLARHLAEQVGDEVEASSPLVVGAHGVPRRAAESVAANMSSRRRA